METGNAVQKASIYGEPNADCDQSHVITRECLDALLAVAKQ